MIRKEAWQILRFAGLALLAMSLAGCWHVKPDSLKCGYGTIETLIGGERYCVVAPLSCGDGTFEFEQATGSERECRPEENPDVLTCAVGTFELEQATGGEREWYLYPQPWTRSVRRTMSHTSPKVAPPRVGRTSFAVKALTNKQPAGNGNAYPRVLSLAAAPAPSRSKRRGAKEESA